MFLNNSIYCFLVNLTRVSLYLHEHLLAAAGSDGLELLLDRADAPFDMRAPVASFDDELLRAPDKRVNLVL